MSWFSDELEPRHLGSHDLRSISNMRHPDGRRTTVPFHSGRDISPFLLRQIAKDIGITAQDFFAQG
jgi:predicted RNA binding protein YcfA (HicA-like mRNA interferase family)